MNQLTLGSFADSQQEDPPEKIRISVLILADINVAWKDRDWHLRAQDIVYLDPELADLLIGRKTAKGVRLP